MSGGLGMVCPSFCNGSFVHSVDMTSAGVGLDSRGSVAEALCSVKREGGTRGRLKPENRFWRFSADFT